MYQLNIFFGNLPPPKSNPKSFNKNMSFEHGPRNANHAPISVPHCSLMKQYANQYWCYYLTKQIPLLRPSYPVTPRAIKMIYILQVYISLECYTSQFLFNFFITHPSPYHAPYEIRNSCLPIYSKGCITDELQIQWHRSAILRGELTTPYINIIPFSSSDK